METITAKTPWAGSMGSMPMHLDYFEGSMFEAVEAIAEKYPNYVAFDFMGKSTTYKKLVQEVETCAKDVYKRQHHSPLPESRPTAP